MMTNFNNCSDIECIRFFTKEICPYYFRFLHTKKDSGGASIHRIDKLFPHCNPLQGIYRVELLHREIPVIITGNEFAEYNFLLFWLHAFPWNCCSSSSNVYRKLPNHTTGSEGLLWYPVIFRGSLTGGITTQLREILAVITGSGFAVRH